jgi:LysM repeat protein
MGIKPLLILLFSITLQGLALAQVFFPLTTRDGVLYHEVFIREGMTLFSISQESNVSSTQIKADNPTLTDNVQLGATVFVRASRSTFSYLALSGDTPFGIAKKFASTLDSLIAINPSLSKGVQLNQHVLIKNGVKRWIDASVNVPAEEGEGPVVERSFRTFEFSDSVITYTVKNGDKLNDVAKRYLISLSELKAFNELRSSSISPGMNLKIPIDTHTDPVSVNPIPPKQSFCANPSKTVSKPIPLNPKPGNKSLRVGVFLPFNLDSVSFPLKGYQKFAFEFYMGVMVGIDSLHATMNGDVYFFDYQSKEESINALISAGKLDRFDVFIGPVHAPDCNKLSAFTMKQGIPLIIPLPIANMNDQLRSNESLFMVASEVTPQIAVLGKTLGELSKNEQVVLFQTGLDSDTLFEKQFIQNFYDYAPKNSRLILANEPMLKAFSKTTSPLNMVCVSQDKKQVVNVMNLFRENHLVELFGLREWTELKEVNSVLDNQGEFNYMSTTCFDLERPRVKKFHKAFRVAYETDLSKSVLLGYDILNTLIPWLSGNKPLSTGLMTSFDYGKTVRYYHSNMGMLPCRFVTFKHQQDELWK